MPHLSPSDLLPAAHGAHAWLAWALQSVMPKLLANRQKTPKEQMIGILDNITVKFAIAPPSLSLQSCVQFT
jgi:hypothetical protein